VGATNRTTVSDYEKAIGPETGLILSVHRSNFYMEGFVESPDLAALAALARKKRIPLLVDLGTGALVPPAEFSDEEPEPTPADTLRKGADLVCFSGDKLFGGPQCGIIAGRKRLVDQLKRNPLFRALRCDKLCLAALQVTVDQHLRGATNEVPALALMREEKDVLRGRAAVIFSQLRGLPARISVGRGRGKAGGGTKPKAVIPSITIDIVPENVPLEEFSATLRRHKPPIIGYIANGVFKLDLRTILYAQDELVVDAVRSVLTTH
jgi:L-seryl-tRNA(Ser) seleniumtransferase